MSPVHQLDVTIVGAGIIGLAAATEIISHKKNLNIAVFEKERYPGEHTSGRNSGVLHAGLYYTPHSLKHKFCLEGNKLWNEWGKRFKIEFLRCGKWVIAKGVQEEEQLKNIFEHAKENGVAGINFATSIALNDLKKDFHLTQAFFSSHTGVINASMALTQLSNFLYQLNVPVLYQQAVHNLKSDKNGIYFQVGNDLFHTKYLINCAGPFAVTMREELGLTELSNYYVKGNYLKYHGVLPYKNLIYPTPPKDRKGLGVHLTINTANEFRFGPNTEDTVDLNYQMNSSTQTSMLAEIKKVFKKVDESKLSLDYCGIRPKILLKDNLYADFWIKDETYHHIPGYIECCGIESPGFTAAPAIAKYLNNLVNL